MCWGCEKGVEAWHHRKSEENMLRQGRRKKNKVVQDLGRLAWHLYLMDLIKKGGKKGKSIGRMQGNKNVH